jgi:hypothetical protein
MAHEVLGAGQRRGPPGHTHRDAGQAHPAGQLGEHPGVSIDRAHAGRRGEDVLGTVAEEVDDDGIERVVHPGGVGEVPVGGRREHRAQLTEPGQVHRVRRRRQDVHVGDDHVRPA